MKTNIFNEMKKKDNRKNFSDFDKFDRKQLKHPGSKEKGSKHKFSIYDDYEEEDLDDSFYGVEDEEDEEE